MRSVRIQCFCREETMMKKNLLMLLILGVAATGFSCASNGYNTQKGALIGAGLGAVAGQIIGNNTAGTLIGAAGGTLLGAVIGNAVDQDQAYRAYDARRQRYAYAAPADPQEQPPGQWIMAPGQWIRGRWVPPHRVWVPVNPGNIN